MGGSMAHIYPGLTNIKDLDETRLDKYFAVYCQKKHVIKNSIDLVLEMRNLVFNSRERVVCCLSRKYELSITGDCDEGHEVLLFEIADVR